MSQAKKKQLPFIPKANNILLEKIESPDKVGSIYIPERVRIPVNQGTIVALGESVDPTLELKVGHIVVFPLHVEHHISVDRVSYLIIKDQDILLSDRGHFESLQNGKETTETN